MSEGKVAGQPRVLLVAASDRRRGAEVFTTDLAEGLSSQGWVVETAGLTRSGDDSVVQLSRLTDVPASEAGRLDLSILRALRRWIDDFRPDVVLAMGGATLRYAALTSRRTPLVYFAIGEPRYWYRSRGAMAVNRWLLRRTDRVIAVCEATRQQLVEVDAGLADRTTVGHTGVHDSYFEIDDRSHHEELRIVFVGSLSKEKDPLMAVRALEMVQGSIMRFVGTGPLRNEIEDFARERHLENRIELVGATNDVGTHLHWADVLVLTSRTEGLPGVVLEAAAARVPTVAVDVGGLSEAVVDGETGLVVDRSAGSIARALQTLSEDPVMLESMGQAAQRRARADFRLVDAVRRFEEILREHVS